MIDFDKIKEALKHEAYKELKKYLVYHLLALRSIDNVKDCSKAVDQAIELKAQRKAYEILSSILNKIISMEEEVPKVETDQTNDFGV